MKEMLLFLTLIPMLAVGASPSTPRAKAEAFLGSVVAGDIAGGYDRLFVGSSIPKSKPQAVTLLKTQTQSGLPLYGKTLGYEFVKEETYGTSIDRLVFILKSEVGPTIWEFYFYKPADSWFLTNVVFNDQYTLLK
jgi:hypothetical protein